MEWKLLKIEFQKEVLIYDPKVQMKYFYEDFWFWHPLVAMKFHQTSWK